ncbi:MAG: SPASM domain-containing protein, partial [Candidatus Heimdallarchaeaceae archaeon]
TIEFLAKLGIDHFAANGIIKAGGGKDDSLDLTVEELNRTLDTIMKKAEELKMRFLWYSPTRYCEFNPVKKGLGVKQCTAGNIAMAIEPDGQVIPCQSYFETIGNILTTPWKKIWNHKTAKRIRKRKNLPQECKGCPEKEICGGGCPLNYQAPITICRDALS